jgi:hypothetical protein
VRRALARVLTLQTATFADDGLQSVPSWVSTSAFTAQLVPASKTDLELAGARGERVTHTALVPYGLTLSSTKNRLLDGSTVFRISQVVPAPKNTVLVLEAMS